MVVSSDGKSEGSILMCFDCFRSLLSSAASKSMGISYTQPYREMTNIQWFGGCNISFLQINWDLRFLRLIYENCSTLVTGWAYFGWIWWETDWTVLQNAMILTFCLISKFFSFCFLSPYFFLVVNETMVANETIGGY